MKRGIVGAMLVSVLGAAPGGGHGQGPEPKADGRDVLRVRSDVARARTWMLGLDAVRVQDARKREVTRTVQLPGWSVARYACPPDIVLDASGTAWVSSNSQPMLWRIDGRSFHVTMHPINLAGREGWDTGFGALSLSAEGALLAATTSAGSLWSIGAGRKSARLVAMHPRFRDICELAEPYMTVKQRSRKP